MVWATSGYVVHGEDGVFDRGDPLLNAWILAWDQHQIRHDPLRLFQANIFHPFADTLAYSEHIVGPALLAAPARLLTSNPIAIQNVSIVTSFVALGVAAFLFFRWVSGNSIAAAFGALAVALAPVRMAELGHVQILHTAGLPVLLYGLWSYLEKPRLGAALLFFAGFLFQALSSFYLASMALLCSLVSLGVAPVLLGWRRVLRSTVLLLPGAAVTGLLLVPFTAPYWRLRKELGFVRSLEGQYSNWASHKAYLRPFPGTGGARLLPDHAGSILTSLYLGIVMVVLALAGTLWWRDRRQVDHSRRAFATALFGAIALAAFVLSLGGWRDLDNGRRLLLPFYFLHSVPGVDGIRATVRFSILVDLAVVGLAVLGLAWIGNRLGRSSRIAAAAAVAGLGLLAAADRMPSLPIAPSESVRVEDEIPHVYRWLARDTGAKVLELPMLVGAGPREGWDFIPYERDYFSTVHWRPTLNGVSGYEPPGYQSVLARMQDFPSKDSLDRIRELPVNRIVVHLRQYDFPIDPDTFRREEGFRLLHECPEDLVVEVRSKTAPPNGVFPEIEVLREPRAARDGYVRVVWGSAAPELLYPPARIRLVLRSTTSAGRRRESSSEFWLAEPGRPRTYRISGGDSVSLALEVLAPGGRKAQKAWNLPGATAASRSHIPEGEALR